MNTNQSKIQNLKSKISHDLSNLLTTRLSRHIVLWVFASLVVIEAIILIPSVQQREREMLNQIRQVSSGKVFWIATTYPNISAEEFLNRVKQLQKDPMLPILGGAVYTSSGQLVGTFGEKPALTHAGVMADQALSEANQEITVLNQKLTAENLRMSAELAVSRKLQQMLLPKEHELNQIPGLEIAGFMEPATEVGGDYYDVLNHKGNSKISWQTRSLQNLQRLMPSIEINLE